MMVSRRKILSRSRDQLNIEQPPFQEEEEDVWFKKEKLFMDHIQEVLNKWESIDDEIWAKIIVLERNRRVAKAYARAPVLTVNGSDDGFDGFRIGLSGFDNPMRDPKTEEVKRHIGQGCKIKMDDSGNILIKRIAKASVFVKALTEENAVAQEILKLQNNSLELDKPLKLFDMKKFQQNVGRELKRAYPDRRKLEAQVSQGHGHLLFRVTVILKNDRSNVDIRTRPRIPIPDEDPYSIAGSRSSGSSGKHDKQRGDRPPKLPPRDTGGYGHPIPKPDYEGGGVMEESKFRQQLEQRNKNHQKKHDDPYYCGLRARIPNFAKSKSQKERESKKKSADVAILTSLRPHFDDVGQFDLGHFFDYESDYSHIYGRLPLPYGRIRQYPSPSHPSSRQMYVSEWE
ncbi:uncharacterized protein LOC111712024 [Eurytemora carolleeae]|uniref:uncharacterized protein LOC111712024 n=1 Tax=Eurytemora carolleeae TaxID=1294199 RepID=UPI000C76E710|nr:uncharacterized protein LOC111712024 [Eurytemora carolleeae]|eukprot:XP_023342300.1 uncharacterized protein LOC111712024 [Eurytemora affinis]